MIPSLAPGAAQVSSVDGYCSGCNRHHIAKSTGRYHHPKQCPKTQPSVLPVMLIGDAGTGVGSRIKGQARRGGNKMREEHIRHCPIAMTDEFRSSKTCIFCFAQVQQARSCRTIGGKVKTVSVHGAIECVNPDCPSVKCGYTIRPRDPHAAVAIAIAGASVLLQGRTLPPFSRRLSAPLTTTPLPPATIAGETTMPWTSTLDASQAPSQELGL